jgi:glycerol-3-phosphate O-acyltransferase
MDEVQTILAYPKLKNYLAENPHVREQVLSHIEEIRGNFNPKVVKSAIRFIDATFGKLYDGVNLEVPQGFDLAALSKQYHIVLVPNHQSHADYIALTYVLFGVYEVPIYIAGGINLNIFPIGSFFRNAGAFFIRRKFNDPVYKKTFEAYVYYLLRSEKVVEFFFEGGRSRTGKLLPPKFGLFQMLLETHCYLEADEKKPFMFIPVALAHEHIPEEKAHAKELGGAKKEAEKSTQLFKIFKLFKKRLGTIHVRVSTPIIVENVEGDIKKFTQDLAFKCFNSVAAAMPVTPSSLLALIVLDEPSGAMTWKNIKDRATEVIDFCRAFNIPMTPSLEDNELEESLTKALNLFVANKKVTVVYREKLRETFYSPRSAARVELLYSKNMILHHFLVPGFINSSLMSLFRGEIKTPHELTRFLMERRKEFKYEFYLPPAKAMIQMALKIVQMSTDREFASLDKSLDLSNEELFKIANRVKVFSTAFVNIYEAYYIACSAVSFLADKEFGTEEYISVARDLFEMEIEHSRFVHYPESFNVPQIKSALDYLQNMKIIERSGDEETLSFKLIDRKKLDEQIEKLISTINDELAINVKFSSKL